MACRGAHFRHVSSGFSLNVNKIDLRCEVNLTHISLLFSDNFFFSVEREKIINIISEEGLQGNDRESRINGVSSLLVSLSSTEAEEDLERYLSKNLLTKQCLPLSFTANKKRKHRKSHGKIGFVEMSKIISSRWKILSKEKVDWYKDLNKLDADRYRKAMANFNKSDY